MLLSDFRVAQPISPAGLHGERRFVGVSARVCESKRKEVFYIYTTHYGRQGGTAYRMCDEYDYQQQNL